MVCRRLIHAIGATAVLVTIACDARGGEAKYPDWRGAWQRWYPPNWVLDPYNGTRTAGGQPSHDQSKPWARGQDAPKSGFPPIRMITTGDGFHWFGYYD